MNVFYNIPESCCKDELKENVCEMSRKLKFGGALNAAIHQQVRNKKIKELKKILNFLFFLSVQGLC